MRVSMAMPTFLRAMKRLVQMRRGQRGPMRPSWDEDFETWARFLHHYAKRSTLLPLRLQRKMLGIAPRSRVVKSMRFEKLDAGGVPAEWFHAPGADASRVLFYLHGGGYSVGSIDSHRELVSRLCVATGATGIAIDYRLAPEHPFPAQLDDALAAYRFLRTRFDASRIVVAGESAGGGLTLSLLVALRDAGEPLPAAAVVISPWVDLEASSGSVHANARYDYISRKVLLVYAARFVRAHEMRHPLAAPLYADLAGLPPLLIQAGGAEALVDDAHRIAARATSAGVDVTLEIEPDMIHAWHMFATFLPPAKKAVERAGTFLREQLDAASDSARVSSALCAG
jgi:monoterpene epsilon-lactone hydrolase